MTNSKLLEEKIKQAGLKKAFIAKSLGITPYGFFNKLQNVTEFKAGEIKQLCVLLNIETFDELKAIFFTE